MNNEDTIYSELIKAVNNLKPYKIDLREKTLIIDGEVLIEDGKAMCKSKKYYDNSDFDIIKSLIDITLLDSNTSLECLYSIYKYSVPGEFRLGNSAYFSAVDVEELNDAQLAYNCQRPLAQAILEGYVLCAGLNGDLNWMFKDNNHWFWQSKINKDFIVMRNYVE